MNQEVTNLLSLKKKGAVDNGVQLCLYPTLVYVFLAGGVHFTDPGSYRILSYESIASN